MGEVYRARDDKLGREVAIKVLAEEFTQHPQKLARFEREARLLAALNHPGIASLYEVEESEGGPFLVMELVEGETLAERMARGVVPVDEALEISRQIAEALEAAHEKGIIHRDLKPANVKVDPEDRVKLLDFGLAKALAEEVPDSVSQSPTLSRDAPTSSPGGDARRSRSRDRRLHEPGAGQREGRRQAHRHLFSGPRHVRDAGRRASLQGRGRARSRGGHHQPGAGLEGAPGRSRPAGSPTPAPLPQKRPQGAAPRCRRRAERDRGDCRGPSRCWRGGRGRGHRAKVGVAGGASLGGCGSRRRRHRGVGHDASCPGGSIPVRCFDAGLRCRHRPFTRRKGPGLCRRWGRWHTALPARHESARTRAHPRY